MENLDFMSEFERIQQPHFRVAIGIIFDIKGWRTLRYHIRMIFKKVYLKVFCLFYCFILLEFQIKPQKKPNILAHLKSLSLERIIKLDYWAPV